MTIPPEVQVAVVPFVFGVLAVACRIGHRVIRNEMGERWLSNLPERRADVLLVEVFEVWQRVLIVAAGLLLGLAWAAR